MSHQDVAPVVPGTEGDWTHPPYAGDIADGYIWGRGALDIKQQVFGVLEAAEYLLSRGGRPARTVYLAFGEDEETYNRGAQAMSDLLKSRGVTLEFVLDEGETAIGPAAAYGAPGTFMGEINLMEKGYADLELSVKSEGGHSSRPWGGTSLGRLAAAITAVTDASYPAELSPPVRQTFAALAPYITEEPLRTLIRDPDKNAAAIARYCVTVPALFPLVTTTVAPTMFCNVKPDCVIENRTIPILYEAPLMLEKRDFSLIVCRELGLWTKAPELSEWKTMKAYSSCVGEGPFTCELFGPEGDALREAGGEYGAATGRPRRVGGFDVVASRYGAKMQGCTYVALTKLDVLSYLEQIPVCAHYEVDGKVVDCFPVGGALDRAKPVYEYLPGFRCDISKCRRPEELPRAALEYIRYLEKQVGCPVKYVSVGAQREDIIEMF